jgi:pantoate--beta-alanine ligase
MRRAGTQPRRSAVAQSDAGDATRSAANSPGTTPGRAARPTGTVAVVGAGRLGTVLVAALGVAGLEVSGPHGRGYSGVPDDQVVLLCVPDAEIASAAQLIAEGPLVGHCSGATGLAAIAPHRGFSIHPVMTFTAQTPPGVLTNIPAAVAGTDETALEAARQLALELRMRPFIVAESDRAAYHASTAMAANFLVTLESAAGTVLTTAGVDRDVLLPLARAALDNWGEQGAAALTGPVARGDVAVVAAHRQALGERTPELLPMFDALVDATERLARTPSSRIDETPSSTRRPAMLVVNTVSDLRRALAGYRNGSIGFVPTMGALHRGHLELLRRARADNDLVVLSVFVNPAQFTDPADLAAYPRTEAQDRTDAENAGVDIYFAPTVDVVYPPAFTARVTLDGPIVDTFEGAHRGSGHFHGVTTVVTKLLMMIGPDRAYFGQKDAQQLRVVQALVTDLNIQVQIVPVPTVREPDGLALSSRNVRLTPEDRSMARGLSQALDAGRASFALGEPAESIVATATSILDDHFISPEYLAVVDGQDFHQVAGPVSGSAVLIVAATIGRIRLIDNIVLQ